MISPTGKSNKRGFTFVELMVVVVILAVMAGIAFPSFKSVFSSTKLDAAGDEISAAMRYAHRFSVMNGLRCRVNFNTAAGEFYLSYEKEPLASPGEFSRIDAEHGRTRAVAMGVVISKMEDEGAVSPEKGFYVTFMPDGTSEKIAMLVSNEAGEGLKITTIPVLGRVKVEHEEEEKK